MPSSPDQFTVPGRVGAWRSRVVVGVVTAILAALLTTTGAPAAQAVAPGLQRAAVHAPAVSAPAGRSHAKKAHAKKAHAKKVRARKVRAARAHAKKVRAARAHRASVLRARAEAKAKAKANAWRYPSRNYVVPANTYFSFPNRSRHERMAIRNRLLDTIRSVWGGRRDPRTGASGRAAGSIRIATWTFDDMGIARALVAARRRGVSVQVVAAADANRHTQGWRYLRKRLGARLYRPGHPETRERSSFARSCRGSCRGHGGTSHAKYFLFHDVGRKHVPYVAVQSSMNLTDFAYEHQWNHAQVLWSRNIYRDFMRVFRQARVGRAVAQPSHVYSSGNVVNIFFPRPGANASADPVMRILDRVHCTGALAGGNGAGRTRIRVIQYAIYGDRGRWIAKRLRYLWSHGCDVRIIYSMSNRAVLRVLRNRSGRGPIPMRRSVIKDGWGNPSTYNHSKWMTVTGHWNRSRRAAITFAGSANWADLAFSSDEQMQRISSSSTAGRYLAAFSKTWRQRTSRVP